MPTAVQHNLHAVETCRPCRAASTGGHVRDRRFGPRPEGGGATVEFVLAVPLLLLIIMFTIQAGVWMHATHIAQAAATRGLDAARADGGSASQGRAAVSDTLTALGNTVLHDPSVQVARTATQARVQITGTAATVVPGVRWPVRATAAGPVERFVPATSRR
jgi:Flp pilus assembly protein TadG